MPEIRTVTTLRRKRDEISGIMAQTPQALLRIYTYLLDKDSLIHPWIGSGRS
jgi:hypothetical protein